jgi:hypothetical protein
MDIGNSNLTFGKESAKSTPLRNTGCGALVMPRREERREERREDYESRDLHDGTYFETKIISGPKHHSLALEPDVDCPV